MSLNFPGLKVAPTWYLSKFIILCIPFFVCSCPVSKSVLFLCTVDLSGFCTRDSLRYMCSFVSYVK